MIKIHHFQKSYFGMTMTIMVDLFKFATQFRSQCDGFIFYICMNEFVFSIKQSIMIIYSTLHVNETGPVRKIIEHKLFSGELMPEMQVKLL